MCFLWFSGDFFFPGSSFLASLEIWILLLASVSSKTQPTVILPALSGTSLTNRLSGIITGQHTNTAQVLTCDKVKLSRQAGCRDFKGISSSLGMGHLESNFKEHSHKSQEESLFIAKHSVSGTQWHLTNDPVKMTLGCIQCSVFPISRVWVLDNPSKSLSRWYLWLFSEFIPFVCSDTSSSLAPLLLSPPLLTSQPLLMTQSSDLSYYLYIDSIICSDPPELNFHSTLQLSTISITLSQRKIDSILTVPTTPPFHTAFSAVLLNVV